MPTVVLHVYAAPRVVNVIMQGNMLDAAGYNRNALFTPSLKLIIH